MIQHVTYLVDALLATVKPDFHTRLGVRYVDRAHGKPLENIEDFVRPEVPGVVSSDLLNQVNQAASEFIAHTDFGSLIARCGYMPPNQTHNPELMPAIDIPSWYLDTDVFQTYVDCCEIDMFRFHALNLDRLIGKMRNFGTQNHQQLEIFGICDLV